MKTIIVWFRNDLRVHDHPALATAVQDGDRIVPVFIMNPDLLNGRFAGSNRNRFLLESLQDLKDSLMERGANLVIREGEPATELKKLAAETNADVVYYSADYTPYAIHRDKHVKDMLGDAKLRSFPGRLIVGGLDKLHTKTGKLHKVFTPFWKNWQQITRRELAALPQKITIPSDVKIGSIPSVEKHTKKANLSPDAQKGGETAARMQVKKFLNSAINDYKDDSNDLGKDTSRMSAYLHFGCISPLEIETMLPAENIGVAAWHRQLAWREFYHYVIYKFPDNAQHEFQEKYRTFKWDTNKTFLEAWQQGKTGYPIVDAAMRQLAKEGWMHNRARLIVGSFLTKDLGLDWREGEQYFMRMLIDGDQANNNGNWQWIASVGVDPAPVFRRLYNPSTQQERHDPDGIYVKKYVPELTDVPDKYLAQPWEMNEDEQQKAGCIIGKDYPKPIVDHKEARQLTLEKYRSVTIQT